MGVCSGCGSVVLRGKGSGGYGFVDVSGWV